MNKKVSAADLNVINKTFHENRQREFAQLQATAVEAMVRLRQWYVEGNLSAPEVFQFVETKNNKTFKALDHERRANGGKNRGKSNIPRDRKIHDAHTRGVVPKDIARDGAIVGDELLTASQVRKILARPRP